MDGNNLINEELCRRKRNNTRLLREEEDRRLIAEGEGKISNGYDEDMLISYLQDQGGQRRQP